MFGTIGVPELVIIGLILLLMFGGRKFPALMTGLGDGIRNFKSSLRHGGGGSDEE